MNFIRTYRLWQVVLAILLLILSYTDLITPGTQKTPYLTDIFKTSIERFIQRTDTLYPKFQNTCHLTYPFSCAEPSEVSRDNDITALRYENNTLVYWNANNIVPRINQLPEPGTTTFKRFKNGIYLCRGFKQDSTSVFFLQPVYFDYNTSNTYLQDHFTTEFPINNNYALSLDSTVESVSIKVSVYPGTVFLTTQAPTSGTIQGIIRFMLLLIGMVLLFQFKLYHISVYTERIMPAFKAPIYFTLVLLTHLFFFLFFKTPDQLRELLILNPNYYASPYVAGSLGTLFIEGIVLFIISAHFYVSPIYLRKRKSLLVYQFISSSFLIAASSFVIVFIYKSLILDSNIAFEFFNPYNPDFNNLINLAAVGILVIIHFILCHKLYRTIQAIQLKYSLLVFIAIGILSVFFSYSFYENIFDAVVVGLLALLPIVTILKIGRINIYLSGISGVFIVLISYSLIISYFVYHSSIEKDLSLRTAYANKLITERDNVTEYLLGEIRNNVLNDEPLQRFFSSNKNNSRNIVEHLNQNYFDDGFNRFNVKYYFYDKDNNPISVLEDEPTVNNNELIGNSVVCGEHELYFLTEPAGNFTYIAEYPIKKDEVQQGSLMVQLTSKVYRSANVYPELLLEEKNKLPISDYSYGIYTGNVLTEHSGNYNYPYTNALYTDTVKDSEMTESRINGYNHLIYKRDMNKTVIVSLQEKQNARFLSYFTYLFIVLIFWALLAWLFFNMKLVMYTDVSTFSYAAFSFRTFIQVSFFTIIFTSVILIGFYTGQFFIKQFNEQTEQKLFEKLEQVAALSNFIIYDKLGTEKIDFGYNTLNDLLRNNITSISSIQKIDVNIYNLNGDLLTTSQPAIFEKGFISRKINPVAYSTLTHNIQSQLIQREQIGELKYLSGYKPIVLKNAEVAAFIHLPYFNSTKYLNEQLGVFFATLISILVFALIAAGLLAPLISKHIARRLDVLAEKFKQVTLGKKNEPIEWHTKDEIGSLVDEFNKMILKLEHNAMLLAKSERESAWREMAKQVAHEIKNPLTPMKLSIQHLQRAYQNDAPNKEELARKVSNTLIEQIDTLTKIANEFSTFAKMPLSEMERLDVVAILQSSYNLYKQNESAGFEIHVPSEAIYVMADRNQLLRVFNNLILNAVQAIPEYREGKVTVEIKEHTGSVLIAIQDNGVGIKEEETARLFTPNFTTKNSGTGLGLAISKNIIEGFGGKIYFKSTPDLGSTFTVELPKVK